MIYALLRAIGGIALRWFYAAIDVEGLERFPRRGPALLAVNHPNALVDALAVGWVVPRRIVITAKATLFRNALFGKVLGSLGVVPLVRTRDLRSGEIGGPRDASRNKAAFRALHDVLRREGAVLIFPEGTTHDEPSLAPLRTGAARIALQARDEAGVRGLTIVPIGLTFDRKDTPRTRVLARIGQPISVDDWDGPAGAVPAQALTDEIEVRLRAVTLNYSTADDAARAAALASLFASLLTDVPSVGATPSLRLEVNISQRIDQARGRLAEARDLALRSRVDELLRRLAAFERMLAENRISLHDAGIAVGIGDGARFLVREGWILALAGPIALWGQINHWLPFHVARAFALRSVETAADPAMRTILAGLILVLIFYGVQASLVAAVAGRLLSLLYVVSLPIAADVNFHLRERFGRAKSRARTYLLFRRDPALRARVQDELRWLREEAITLAQLLDEEPATRSTVRA